MEFAVWPSFQRSWAETLDLARWAAGAGFAQFWYADHLMANTDDDRVDADDSLEGWTVLAAVAASVPGIRLTSMVSPVTIHHPVVLAKRAVTVDHLSGGRATLGLGAGWQVNEHRAYGFDLRPVGERVSHFAEAIEVIHRLLRDDHVSFEGRWYHLDGAPLRPRPIDLPLLVGTGSPRMMGIRARFADEWNTWGDPTQVAERTSVFVAAAERAGADPSRLRRSAQALVFLVDDPATASRLRESAPAGRSLVGGAGELVELLGRYVDLGVDCFAVPDFVLGDSPGERADTYARLHDEVLSAFR
jgi:alkanesulfonate monooxygenase SsuD/methylene tetrahydromethanopterin reductase-like flavin-dependent oxidoreductase (luciferase family)